MSAKVCVCVTVCHTFILHFHFAEPDVIFPYFLNIHCLFIHLFIVYHLVPLGVGWCTQTRAQH